MDCKASGVEEPSRMVILRIFKAFRPYFLFLSNTDIFRAINYECISMLLHSSSWESGQGPVFKARNLQGSLLTFFSTILE